MSPIYIVIPTYNESGRLNSVVSDIFRYIKSAKIVVVDDGSNQPVKPSNRFVLLRHKINLGKGAAMNTGAEYAIKNNASAIIFMDADGQHEAKYLPTFIHEFKNGYDVVLGSRRPKLAVPMTRLLGNKLASVYINILFGIYVSDILSGFRLISVNAYQKIRWTSQRYGVETEMIARLGKNKSFLKWTEFPIEPIYIDKYKGVTIIDAIKVLFDSLWWKHF